MTQQEFFKRYKYSIRTDKVGGGAFGTVYKAFDEILNREVAIKVSEVKIMGGKEFSLKDEFDAIKDVPVHPNIANYEELITLEMPNGIFDYAVMQFYKDGNLSSFIKSNPTFDQKEQVACTQSGASRFKTREYPYRKTWR
jgi:serine/threonine protein kinase